MRMMAGGAAGAEIIPARESLAEAGLKVIQAQAKYEGGYWNTTGIARPVTVAAILPELSKRGAGVLFHGATGRGNDQVSFQLSVNMLEPTLEISKIYVPIKSKKTRFIEGPPSQAAEELVRILRDEARVC